MRSLHKDTIFTTLRYLLAPKAALGERIVVSKLALRGIYRIDVLLGMVMQINLVLKGMIWLIKLLRLYRLMCSTVPIICNSTEESDETFELKLAKLAGVLHILGKMRCRKPGNPFHIYFLGSNTFLDLGSVDNLVFSWASA
ncbi:hypothetical protein CQW23_19199 [Capsicum baccatum]|uniref:Uncharacterized protein n=1 Tax=Capsicum baccatum TaxID=33114 RepID=A0A2G2W537_CAPBA|nr:hypothetical protein CQW23_19199 [Capsicum baccatum]